MKIFVSYSLENMQKIFTEISRKKTEFFSERKKCQLVFLRVFSVFAAILILAVTVRIVYILGNPIETRDGIAYINFTQKWFEQGDAALPKHETIAPPLYCYLGKTLMSCGMSAANALLAINMVCGILLLIPAYLIGKHVYNDRNAGLWFAAFAAVMPPLVKYSCERLREGLYLFFLFWIVCLWIMIFRGIRQKLNSLLLGALCVTALFCRFEAVEMLPFVLCGLPLAVLLPNWKWKDAFMVFILLFWGVLIFGAVMCSLPGMPDIFNIFYNRIFSQCLGTSLNPL